MRLALAALGLLSGSCSERLPHDHARPATAEAGAVAESSVFADATAPAGIAFVHDRGGEGDFLFREIMGAGAALADFDGDGDLDLYLVQSGPVRPQGGEQSDSEDRLLRNDSDVGASAASGIRFTDVTGPSGLRATGYGMGVATGDFDNDGHLDLYVANVGQDQLWRNRGDGRFEPTPLPSAERDAWSAGAVFFDYDRDGWLDLYVVHYVDDRLDGSLDCRAVSSHRDYCGPHNFPGIADRLYRNLEGEGFEDVSRSAGILREAGRGLAATSLDADQDGWIDLYVANDLERNILWRNQGDGTFIDIALMSGSAVNQSGHAEASMGLVASDLDGDGDEDLFAAHLREETHTVYRNDGRGTFTDVTQRAGLGAVSLGATGFGAVALDYDGDSWLDLMVTNGAVKRIEDQGAAGNPFPYGQADQLFRNVGGRFELAGADESGDVFSALDVGRGLALGDVNNDGAPDVLIARNGTTPRLLIHRSPPSFFVGLRVRERSGRDALGAWVITRTERGAVISRRVRTDGSYASAHDPRVLIAFPRDPGAVAVEVQWVGGAVESWKDVPLGVYTDLVRGSGE